MKQPDIKISFIECPIVVNDTEKMYSPTWAYVLAANIQTMKGVEYSLYDLKIISSDEINCSDIFAFSPRLYNLEQVKKISHQLKVKYPNSISIMGGPTVFSLNSTNRLEEIDCFDYYFLGRGEKTLPQFLELFQKNTLPTEKLIENASPFRFKNSIPMISPLLESTIQNYRIPMIEISRGCPFSCDFCDAPILNNVWDTRSPKLIISELQKLHELKIKIVFFACDNILGNKVWAEKVCDSIIEWREKTNTSLLFFTFASIDLAKHPTLMQKMRLAGCYSLFIGVESFAKSSLLEINKVQNLNNDLISSLKIIQSYGFLISTGLIYGFDNDPDDIIDITLQGILKSGILNTSFCLLEALPGTKLYKKMEDQNRIIRAARYQFSNQQLTTNILLKKDKTVVERDLRSFQYGSSKGKFRYNIFKNNLKLFSLGNFIALPLTKDIVVKEGKKSTYDRPHSKGLNRLKKQIENIKKILKFISKIENIYYSFCGLIYTIKSSNNRRYRWKVFTYWLSCWIALYGVGVKAPLSSDNLVSIKKSTL